MGFKLFDEISNEEVNVIDIKNIDSAISPDLAIEQDVDAYDMMEMEKSCEQYINKISLANEVVSNGIAMSNIIVDTNVSNEDNFVLNSFNNTIAILGISNEDNAVGFYDPEAASKFNKNKTLSTDSKSLLQKIIAAIKAMFKKIVVMIKKLYVKSLKVINGMTTSLVSLVIRMHRLKDGSSVKSENIDINSLFNNSGALALLTSTNSNERHFTPSALKIIENSCLNIVSLADYKIVLGKIVSQMKSLGKEIEDDNTTLPSAAVTGFINEIRSSVTDTLDGPMHESFMKYFKDDLAEEFNNDVQEYVVPLISKISGKSVKVVVVVAPKVDDGEYSKAEIISFTNKINIVVKTYTFDDKHKDIFAKGIKDTDANDIINLVNNAIRAYFGDASLVNNGSESLSKYVSKRFKEYNDAAFKLIDVSDKEVAKFSKEKDENGLALLDMVPLKFINVGMTSITLDAVTQYISVIKNTFSYYSKFVSAMSK